jgi:hypothetical protein
MALRDKLKIGKWNVTGFDLVVRTFDNGTTFVLTEQKNAANDEFVLRTENILDRDDVTLSLPTDMDKAAVKAAILDYTFAAGTPTEGSVGFPTGLCPRPTNFSVPAGYTEFVYPDGTGTVGFIKSNATPTGSTPAGAAGAGAPAKTAGSTETATGFFTKYKNWIIGVGAAIVAGIVFLFVRKKGKKSKK